MQFMRELKKYVLIANSYIREAKSMYKLKQKLLRVNTKYEETLIQATEFETANTQ